MASLLTINGVHNSLKPCSSVWRSSIKLITALSSLEPNPFNIVNLVPAILVALSKSKISKLTPISQWAFGSKSNFVGSPHFLISRLSSSVSPVGVSRHGVFGIPSKVSFNFSSITLTSSSNALICSESSFISAIIGATSWPSFFNFGICFETTFCLFFISSTFWRISLLSLSSFKTSSRPKSPLPLSAIAFLTSSTSFLILFKSNIILPP